ncbi:MAG: CocE/NonD family hydrolase [Nitriliruptorales bacterium]|nr:CocE/NonD family hydrolase [Nitriliruptorales bacterium]
MQIDIDVPIEADDGTVLRADVYRPIDDAAHPVILSSGPYAKLLHYQDGSPHQWGRMSEEHPETVQGTSNTYQSWEVVDPEKWVPDGYAVVRVDSRGSGRSPGHLDLLSPRETQDLSDCIEWAAAQPWCNGKVGLNGISYYGMNQWQVAELRPPHLAAMCVWEGASDLYRDMFWHGGIHCRFGDVWFHGRVIPRQHGVGSRGARSRLTGDWVAGPETLPNEVLEASRSDFPGDALAHPLLDAYWDARVPDLSKIEVPFLSAGNWGGAGLHLRGNVEGFVRSASRDKWLEIHGRQHWTHFFTDYGVALQKRFFGHFLKGEDTGWDTQPRVQLQIRHPGERFVERHEDEWPLARTGWTRFYLQPDGLGLSTTPSEATAERSYDGLGDGLTFLTAPLAEETEITGPAAAKLLVSSATSDADIFCVLRVFRPDLREVTFHGANEPHAPVAQGWLRASHRKLDPDLSQPYRPFHTHDEHQPLTPGEVYELDVEIWPTSIVVPAGYRIGLSVRGCDYLWSGAEPTSLPATGQGATAGAAFTGVGPFRHSSGTDRPPNVFGGKVTLHWRPDCQPYLLLPVIPPV